MAYTRAHIRLTTNTEAAAFVSMLNSDGTTNKYMLESADGTHRVDARSLLGVLYFSVEHNDDTYLVNESDKEAALPTFIDQFRV